MNLTFSAEAWEDYRYWQDSDAAVLVRVNALLKECARTPFSGIGKPEALKNDLRGWWSRRITQEHRLVYRIYGAGAAQTLEIAACRQHYR